MCSLLPWRRALPGVCRYVDVEGGLEITFETVLANGKVKRISIPVSSIYDDADNGTAAAADDLAALDSMMAAAEAEEEQSDGSAAEAAARRRQ